MEQLIDGRGGRLDLMVRAGTDMPAIELTLTQDDGTPVDLTGSTLVCRAATRHVVPVAMSLVATVVGLPTAGVVALSFADTEIDKMDAPSVMSSKPAVGGDWSLDQQVASGDTVPLLFGQVFVGAKVPV